MSSSSTPLRVSSRSWSLKLPSYPRVFDCRGLIEVLTRRGRVGRGNRIILDRVKELKPRYGNQSQEIYRGTLPMGGVRSRPENIREESTVTELIQGIAMPGLEKPAVLPFNHMNGRKATSVKRRFEEVMQDHTTKVYYKLDQHMALLASEMPVKVQPMKRLLLKRNTANDQVEFFL